MGENASRITAFDNIEDAEHTFDQKFKQLFSKKEFLVPILRNIVPEYEYLSFEKIESLISINDDTCVNPQAYSSEDVGKGDETVTHYDVLVSCHLDSGESVYVDFFFDLEMQRDNTPGYPIPKRGIYYCCRLISRQIETLGEEQYKKLRPVYSVWIILNNIPKKWQNSIYTAGMKGRFNRYDLDSQTIDGQIDLIHLSLIYLSPEFDPDTNQDDLIRYLQSVFAKQIDNPKYNPYYDYSKKIKEEVDEYMTFSQVFEERGRERGRGEGAIEILLESGFKDGEIITKLVNRERDPLTVEEAKEALNKYKKENNLI